MVISVATHKASHKPTPAHALAPALAQLSVVNPPSLEHAGFEDVGTSSVFSLTPIFS